MPVDIAPTDFMCDVFTTMTWAPDGQHIVFIGGFPEEHPHHPQNYGYDNSSLWIMDRDGHNSHPINLDVAYGRWPEFIDWMDDHTLAYKSYAGGGHHYISILDVSSGEENAWGLVHIGGSYGANANYVASNNGMLYDYNISTVAISRTVVFSNTEFISGPYLFCISGCNGMPADYPSLSIENSHFQDWLPHTNIMLVLTWKYEDIQNAYLTVTEPQLNYDIPTKLQLWDVDNHTVSVLIEDGTDGRFSPDGKFLAFRTLQPQNFLHLFDMATKQIVLSLPSADPVRERVFRWSPTSQKLIYQDEQGNWTILDINTHQRTPLTTHWGKNLTNPQWSTKKIPKLGTTPH